MSSVLNAMVSPTLIYFPDSTCVVTTQISFRPANLKLLHLIRTKFYCFVHINIVLCNLQSLYLQLQVDGLLDSLDLCTLAASFFYSLSALSPLILLLDSFLSPVGSVLLSGLRENLKDPV